MKIHCYAIGVYQANCYIIENEKELLVIDPGAKPKKLYEIIETINKPIVGILLTHGHFDHIGGVDEMIKRYSCPLYMSSYDYEMACDPQKNYSIENREVSLKAKPIFINQGKVSIESFEITVMEAPGHSEGSLLFGIETSLFTGDVLFKGSIGRTDLYCSNNGSMKNSLQMIATLNPHYVIYPGHGEASTLHTELLENAYL